MGSAGEASAPQPHPGQVCRASTHSAAPAAASQPARRCRAAPLADNQRHGGVVGRRAHAVAVLAHHVDGHVLRSTGAGCSGRGWRETGADRLAQAHGGASTRSARERTLMGIQFPSKWRLMVAPMRSLPAVGELRRGRTRPRCRVQHRARAGSRRGGTAVVEGAGSEPGPRPAPHLNCTKLRRLWAGSTRRLSLAPFCRGITGPRTPSSCPRGGQKRARAVRSERRLQTAQRTPVPAAVCSGGPPAHAEAPSPHLGFSPVVDLQPALVLDEVLLRGAAHHAGRRRRATTLAARGAGLARRRRRAGHVVQVGGGAVCVVGGLCSAGKPPGQPLVSDGRQRRGAAAHAVQARAHPAGA